MTPPPPTDAAPAPTPVEPAVAPKYLKPSARSVVVMVVVALLGIALILRAWHLWPFTSSVMVTDNAYVRGQITVMAPQVNGYVTEVLVKDFQHVRQGEPLLHIDDRIYAQRVAQAQATLDSARARWPTPTSRRRRTVRRSPRRAPRSRLARPNCSARATS